MIKKITIIGSGNVATQFSLAFKKVNIEIVQIISRNKQSGKQLAKKINTSFSHSFKQILNTDLIIICVNDDEIKNVIKKLPNYPMAHTSGSTDINIFRKQKIYGVVYPLQSLNKGIQVDFQNIPICPIKCSILTNK